MLTAWDDRKEKILAVPDFEAADGLNTLRDWARAGRVVCPVCHEKLWLRIGEKRCPHLAHRKLAECPHGKVSVGIIETRRMLYRFFQERIQAGKLTGPIDLEPAVAGVPDRTRVDLVLRREAKASVAIVLLESGFKPDLRWALRSAIQEQGMIFRPVFLTSTLNQKAGSIGVFLLNSTQREFMHKSRFGLAETHYGRRGDALHFVDYEHAHWTSLRGLRLEHSPQVYGTESVRHSPMNELLWSESQAEWTHPNEPRAKKAPSPETLPPLAPPPHLSNEEDWDLPETLPLPATELPDWITGGLVCTGCQVRTLNWQTAIPGAGVCICKTCFAKGVR